MGIDRIRRTNSGGDSCESSLQSKRSTSSSQYNLVQWNYCTFSTTTIQSCCPGMLFIIIYFLTKQEKHMKTNTTIQNQKKEKLRIILQVNLKLWPNNHIFHENPLNCKSCWSIIEEEIILSSQVQPLCIADIVESNTGTMSTYFICRLARKN
jgi:hypothetical protein